MRAEFEAVEAAGIVVATATWDGRSARIEGSEGVSDEVTDRVRSIYRTSAVVIDDPAFVPVGASGPVVLQPGDLRWFMAASRARAKQAGFAVRLVPDERAHLGWDPAGAYRTFPAAVGLTTDSEAADEFSG